LGVEVSSKDLRTAQRDALSALQLRTSSPADASMQQLAQAILRPDTLAGGESTTTVIGEQYLICSMAGCDLAVKAELVQGVERLLDLTMVPNVLPWVRGVMNLRGSIISVVDLRMFLGLEQLPSTARTRLLSLQYNEMAICFIVDGVSEMLPIPPSTISNGNTRQAIIPNWVLPYSSSIALLDKRVVVILDVPRLLFSEKMQHYEFLG
jgi:purine-binding chemotaxis protein CheW